MCEKKYSDAKQIERCKHCTADTTRNGAYHVKSYGEYCYITKKMVWEAAKSECEGIGANLPHIKLNDQNAEVGSITGVIYYIITIMCIKVISILMIIL